MTLTPLAPSPARLDEAAGRDENAAPLAVTGEIRFLGGPVASSSADELCHWYGTDADAGLDRSDAVARLERYGPNRLADPPTRSRWARFADQFRNILVLVLVGAALLALALGDVTDAIVVTAVLMLNAALGYVQEGRAAAAMASLRQMLATRARVRRHGSTVEVAAEELVPGDVVLLEAGDRVPADGRIIEAVGLGVDESSLTGESVPALKSADAVRDDLDAARADRANEAFMNTTVAHGRGVLLVTRTGMATEIGRMAAMMESAPVEPTPLQGQLDRLGRRLALVAGVAMAAVLSLRLLQGEPLAQAALEAIALAIAAIPEGLPAVVTVTLAVGVHQMALRNAIVRRLAAVETLGSTTVICTDKTGTLTQNRMTVRAIALDPTAGGAGPVREEARPLLTAAVLCSDATLDRDGATVGDPTEGALLHAAAELGIDPGAVRRDQPRVGEVPFDSATKMMATFHLDGDSLWCVAKGAPEVLLARCSSTPVGPLDAAGRVAWEQANAELAAGGMRVLAVASRRLPAAGRLDAAGRVVDPASLLDGLGLDGLIGLLDPPRPEARDAIALCRTAGIDVKMITGDHPATAAAIAADLGIVGRAVTGADLDRMTDADLAEQVEGIGVFARVAPVHKVRVVQALKHRGHIVAMTGDGVNDAAALQHAHVGVAMGITGTEVTKEAADIVLADDNFATIVSAVERGRSIHDNIVKFVRFQTTTNLGAIGTLVGASVLGIPAPLSAAQVLFVNLIADGPPAMTLGVDPATPDTMRRPPATPGAPILHWRRFRSMLAAAVVMAIGTLGVFAFADARWGTAVATTMAFTTFVAFQLANVVSVRSERASVFTRHSLANPKLWAAVGIVAAVQVLVVTVGPLRSLFDTTPLSALQWLVCLGAALTLIATEELRKALERRAHRSIA